MLSVLRVTFPSEKVVYESCTVRSYTLHQENYKVFGFGVGWLLLFSVGIWRLCLLVFFSLFRTLALEFNHFYFCKGL